VTVSFKFNVRIEDFHKFYERLGKTIYKKIQMANEKAGQRVVVLMQKYTKAYDAIGPGTQMTPFIQGWRVHVLGRNVFVTNVAKHAWYVLHGSRMGKPGKIGPGMILRLKEWMAFKGMDPIGAYALAKAIQRRGIRARPMLDDAYMEILEIHAEEVEKRLDDAYLLAAGR